MAWPRRCGQEDEVGNQLRPSTPVAPALSRGLIACHTWDTLGAVAAGWQAALIKRVGNDVLGVGPQPQIVGR
jgi:hypothetical protein